MSAHLWIRVSYSALLDFSFLVFLCLVYFLTQVLFGVISCFQLHKSLGLLSKSPLVFPFCSSSLCIFVSPVPRSVVSCLILVIVVLFILCSVYVPQSCRFYSFQPWLPPVISPLHRLCLPLFNVASSALSVRSQRLYHSECCLICKHIASTLWSIWVSLQQCARLAVGDLFPHISTSAERLCH